MDQLEVRTFVESLDIGVIASRREQVLGRYFQRSEIAALKGVPDQTVVGHLALKRAARRLLQAIGVGDEVGEQEIAVEKNERGAPRLVFPAKIERLMGGAVSGSVSHTRDNAYGMAVIALEKKTDGP
jgi:holo-[acyl-carrier-protein] synthase